MPDLTATRRSGRGRVPNKKYTIDAFEGLDIFDSDTERNTNAPDALDDSGIDQDFKSDTAAEETEATDTDVVSADDGSDGSGIATPLEDYGDAASYVGEVELSERPKSSIEKHTSRLLTQTKSQSSFREKLLEHSRGVPEPVTYSRKSDHMRHIFGNGTEDILQAVRSREQWVNNPTLPKRNLIEQGSGGLAFPFSHTTEKRHMEATVGWDWYFKHDSQASFAKQQRTILLDADTAIQYISRPKAEKHSFLMGPYGNQRVFSLDVDQSMNTAQAWEPTDLTLNSSQSAGSSDTRCRNERTNWMLNIGNKIRCLDWAANHEEIQYLAVASGSVEPITSTSPASAPAFTPSLPTCTSFQIWSFYAVVQRDEASYICANRPPELRLVGCTEWGNIRHLKWCHVPCATRSEGNPGRIFVGLLAGIWGDGYARILDIQLDKESTPTTHGTFCLSSSSICGI